MTQPTANRPLKQVVIAVLAALFGIYVFYSVATDEANGTEHAPEISRGEAWHLCKEAVLDLLKNPQSADFALLSTDFAETADGGWSIAGSLTAVNDFNAEQEIGFRCGVEPDSTVTAQVS